MLLDRIGRLINTLKYLKLQQAYYFVRRRGLGLSRVVAGIGCLEPPKAIGFKNPLTSDTSLDEQQQQFRFLNVSRAFDIESIDWAPQDKQRLWRYNLHYFDYLRSDNVSDLLKSQLLDSWIANNPQGSEPAWEPYTASLRIVNWVIYFSTLQKESVKEDWLDSLFTQCRWLNANLEYHILANHYFENLKAQIFAGIYFNEHKEGAAWLISSAAAMAHQIDEQFFADGGHYERSPQYHAIMIGACLDLYNLCQSNTNSALAKIKPRLRQVIERGIGFMASIVRPDGEIPLFNDSTFFSGPNLVHIHNYAASLGIVTVLDDDESVIDQNDTGIYGYRSGQDWIAIDCGDVGPDYQPGHTHCDFLSYELMFDGLPVVVDTGVYEYEPGPLRHAVRTTAAHNTVSVGGDEQSEVWGEFRVARRARRLKASIAENEKWVDFSGAFSGFYGLASRVQHSRDVTILKNAGKKGITSVKIADSLSGKGNYRLSSYVHLHPSIEPVIGQDGVVSLLHRERTVAEIQFHETGDNDIELIDTAYFPEFGKRLANKTLVYSQQVDLPVQFGYTITKKTREC